MENLSVGDAVLVAASAVGEVRWGFHQFPALSRMPDGTLMLMYADAEDASETHGAPAPCYTSADSGKSWSVMRDFKPTRPHFSISEVFGGDYLAVPSMPYIRITADGIQLPEPAATGDTYGTVYTYRIADMPHAVQSYFRYLPARRWSPGAGWQETRVEYDMDGLLAWRRGDSDVLPRTFFERPLIRYNNELLYADYRGRYARDDGSVAAKGFSSLMVSEDNGRSFKRRSTIAVDLRDKDLMGEPQLAVTADGRLVCVIRRTDQDQKPMCITWSDDGGVTWTPVKDLFEFGVWPCVLCLGNGTMVLSYGRPGVHLAFDPDGNGESWSRQVSLIDGDPAETARHTCGYTSLMALDDESFLIAYSDFSYRDDGGEPRKAIFTRRITAHR